MSFKKYHSIENAFTLAITESVNLKRMKEFLNLLSESDDGFFVEEKLHGANFTIYKDRNSNVYFGRRNGLIKEGESFYNYQYAYNQIADKVERLFHELFDSYYADTIAIVCELIGGSYPHPDVEQVKGQKRVMKEIYYSPINILIPYDIRMQYEHTSFYMPLRVRDLYFMMHDLPPAPVLASGTLEQCLKHNNKFITTIPERYGLPEIEGNYCEGIVIKKIIPKIMSNGKPMVLKSKNEKFREGNKPKKKVRKKIDKGLEEVLNRMTMLITANRFNAVLSKSKQPDGMKYFGEFIKDFSQDLLEDYNKQHNDFSQLNKVEQKVITDQLNKKIVPFIKYHYIKLT